MVRTMAVHVQCFNFYLTVFADSFFGFSKVCCYLNAILNLVPIVWLFHFSNIDSVSGYGILVYKETLFNVQLQ